MRFLNIENIHGVMQNTTHTTLRTLITQKLNYEQMILKIESRILKPAQIRSKNLKIDESSKLIL